MKILIAYDVSTVEPPGQKRLRRVARACADYGQRVQKSIFECNLGDKEWAELKSRLLDEIDNEQDSLRFYYLAGDTRIEHLGYNQPIDLNAPLVI